MLYKPGVLSEIWGKLVNSTLEQKLCYVTSSFGANGYACQFNTCNTNVKLGVQDFSVERQWWNDSFGNTNYDARNTKCRLADPPIQQITDSTFFIMASLQQKLWWCYNCRGEKSTRVTRVALKKKKTPPVLFCLLEPQKCFVWTKLRLKFATRVSYLEITCINVCDCIQYMEFAV